MQRTHFAPVAVTLMALFSTACGFKGDLYMPSQEEKSSAPIIEQSVTATISSDLTPKPLVIKP